MASNHPSAEDGLRLYGTQPSTARRMMRSGMRTSRMRHRGHDESIENSQSIGPEYHFLCAVRRVDTAGAGVAAGSGCTKPKRVSPKRVSPPGS